MNEMIPEENKSEKILPKVEFAETLKTLQDKCDEQEKAIADLQCKADLQADVFQKCLDGMYVTLNGMVLNHGEIISGLGNTQNKITASLSNFLSSDEKQNKQIGDLIETCGTLSNRIDALEHLLKSYCHRNELNNLRDICDVRWDAFKEQFVSINDCDSKLRSDLEKCKVEIQNLVETIRIANVDVMREESKVRGELIALQAKIADNMMMLKAEIEKVSLGIQKAVDDKVSAIPVPQIPNLDEVKAQFVKQLEPIAFDAKNANIRSTNTDMKLHVLEKKIEQLSLMVEQLNLKV